MKILKSGQTKRDPEAHCRCMSCECEFIFARSEATLRRDPRDGDAYTIKCPECKDEQWVDAQLFQ